MLRVVERYGSPAFSFIDSFLVYTNTRPLLSRYSTSLVQHSRVFEISHCFSSTQLTAFSFAFIKKMKQITLALNRPDMAYSAADALASAMYDSMFDWLVGRVNFAVQVRLELLIRFPYAKFTLFLCLSVMKPLDRVLVSDTVLSWFSYTICEI